MENRNVLSVIVATLAASLCCVTPVLAVLAGSSTFASSFSCLEPYHNYLVAFTILVLIYAWYDKLKPSKDIDCACDEKSGFFSSKLFLAIVTVFSALMLTFPLWGYDLAKGNNTELNQKIDEVACDTCTDTDENKTVTKVDVPSLPNAENKPACNTGSCPTQRENKTANATVTSDLPVLHYMDDEKNNPTECGQVACSGTGYKELDDLMAQARREIEEMSPAVLKKMIDDEVEFTLLDVRPAIQRAEGEIYADSMLAIPRTNLEFEVLNILKDKGATIVVYSRMGARSLFAAQSLKKLGYTNVYNLSAGLKGWVRAGYPYDNGLGTVLKVVDAQ
ncbi:rhodanese-like domain-containing protein [Sulfurimonas aquatica]|uniref:Mercuric transport protein MerT n=1 Tax=Sulfurimonas aquatica TaxID=2672570 RepID=A0A975AZX5_9BACT|nr:mercuric transporter MerT family protein [Sulfurimonas aquatica]QSZ41666.1 rhodanese-like domain-containing protein [Sulfurimonas aquatica]